MPCQHERFSSHFCTYTKNKTNKFIGIDFTNSMAINKRAKNNNDGIYILIILKQTNYYKPSHLPSTNHAAFLKLTFSASFNFHKNLTYQQLSFLIYNF